MGIEAFLSKENINLHKEYVTSLKLKKGMVEKIFEKPISDEILSHEIFFSSFSLNRIKCDLLKKYYGSESRFCYLLKEYAKQKLGEFIYIYLRGSSVIFSSDKKHLPECLLAIDSFEHSYFFDYRFDYDSYLEACISHLDFSKINSAKRVRLSMM